MFTHNARRRAVIGLLGGFLVAGAPSAFADDGLKGPLVALDKAKKAADAESGHAAATDAAAAPMLEDQPTTMPRTGADAKGPDAATGKAPTADAPVAALAPESPYDPASHRDPFKPPTIASSGPDNPRTPLERYEIGQLKLVGVVWDTGEPRAMVEDSAGLGYILTVNTPIGASGGVVKSIEPRRVLIEEQVQNFYGENVPREVVMELPQEDRSP